MRTKLRTFLHTKAYKYIITIEGGGSKTIIEVLNNEGVVQRLRYHDEETVSVITGGCNPNTKSSDALYQQFGEVFENAELVTQACKLKTILPKAVIVGGVAGVGNVSSQQQFGQLFAEFGFITENLFLVPDGDMSLAYSELPAMMLIAGTGSICLGTTDGEHKFEAGGYGPAWSDPGSGYYMGMKLLEFSFDVEHGVLNINVDNRLYTAIQAEARRLYGQAINPDNGEFYLKSDKPDLMPLCYAVNRKILPPVEVAKLAHVAFDEAYASPEEPYAMAIVDRSAQKLTALMASVWRQMRVNPVNVLLVGGVFKSPHAEKYILLLAHKLQQLSPSIKLQFTNSNGINVVTGTVQKLLRYNKI